MQLSTRLAHYFAGEVRARGQEYFWNRRVRIKLGQEDSVEAEVRGNELYDVSVDLYDENELDLWCDCAYFESTGPCKHVWATILAAEAKGLLLKVARARDLHIDT